ncbi:PREDICTED: T-box protein 2-like [Amphimedon queenslandica]|uniref:T-box domain-containing protein n=1 Tax=Amphimedon queenslandica TaxID=400682 RepID=A0A1X7TXK0_AMPQE|nr:uncharacterized protein LOC100635833 [Amphimedon queenslandica]|eukprot:XP_003389547.1 PREDICTED: T-box protein 2-like [Amphimedon queenslandica]
MNSAATNIVVTAPSLSPVGTFPHLTFKYSPAPGTLHHTPIAAGYHFSPYSFPPIYLDTKPDSFSPVFLQQQPTNGGSSSDEEKQQNGSTPDLIATPPALAVGPAIYAPSSAPVPPSATDKPAKHKEQLVPSAVLTENQLWKAFDTAGNEMIVTKPGRLLFPTILVTVSGLVPTIQYSIMVRFVSADKYRHKYITGQWTAVGESDIIHDESKMLFIHPSSPCYGEMWIKKPISFKSIKITHHSESQNGNILLHTMHKYRIEVVVQPHNDQLGEIVFPLAHSEFIAVTSYQSSAITKLKVDNNPFAKGFRDRETFISPYSQSYAPFLPPYTPFVHPLWANVTNTPSGMYPNPLAPVATVPPTPQIFSTSMTTTTVLTPTSSVQPLFPPSSTVFPVGASAQSSIDNGATVLEVDTPPSDLQSRSSSTSSKTEDEEEYEIIVKEDDDDIVDDD